MNENNWIGTNICHSMSTMSTLSKKTIAKRNKIHEMGKDRSSQRGTENRTDTRPHTGGQKYPPFVVRQF